MKKGRKAREWSEEEIKDLFVLSMKDFCEKHKCSENVFYKAYYNNTKHTDEKCSIFDNLILLLPDIEILINNGMNSYMKHLSSKQSELDKAKSDLDHIIELRELTQNDVNRHYDISKKVLSERRTYKTASAFVGANNARLVSLFGLIKVAKESVASQLSKKYRTRVLGEEFGDVITK